MKNDIIWGEDVWIILMMKAMVLCEYKTRAGARRLLDRMIQNNNLKRIGSGPGTKYIFNDDK